MSTFFVFLCIIKAKTERNYYMPLHYNNETCSGCKTCQLACALYNFNQSNPTRALLNVFGKFPAPGKYYVELCDQCGLCADACPANAIQNQNGVFLISIDECISCDACAGVCPKNVIRMIYDLAYKCTCCGQCAKICPRDAITLVNEGASA